MTVQVAAPGVPTQPSLSGGPWFWFDAILPDDLNARVLIEQGLTDRSDDAARDNNWKTYAEHTLRTAGQDMLATIDGERLVSLCLRHLMGYQVIEPSVIRRWEEADEYRPGRVAGSSAHDLIPPLFVSVAEAWLAAGDPQRALDHVARHRQEALGTRDDLATVRHADAATVRIARRLRLGEQLALLHLAVKPDMPGPVDLTLADDARRALAVLRRESPPYTAADVTVRPAGWHTWWQCQTVSVGPVPAVLWYPAATDTVLAADIELDLNELGQLSQARQRQLLTQPALAPWLARPRLAPHARSAEPYRHVRAELRRSALSAAGTRSVVPTRSELPPGVPPRLVAEMAFEEAELLALRFPGPAALASGAGGAAYEAAGDQAGPAARRARPGDDRPGGPGCGRPPDEAALARFHRRGRPDTAYRQHPVPRGRRPRGGRTMALLGTHWGASRSPQPGRRCCRPAPRAVVCRPLHRNLGAGQEASGRLPARARWASPRPERPPRGGRPRAGRVRRHHPLGAGRRPARLHPAYRSPAPARCGPRRRGHGRRRSLAAGCPAPPRGRCRSRYRLQPVQSGVPRAHPPGRHPGSYSTVLWVHLHSPWQAPPRQRSRLLAVALAVPGGGVRHGASGDGTGRRC